MGPSSSFFFLICGVPIGKIVYRNNKLRSLLPSRKETKDQIFKRVSNSMNALILLLLLNNSANGSEKIPTIIMQPLMVTASCKFKTNIIHFRLQSQDWSVHELGSMDPRGHAASH